MYIAYNKEQKVFNAIDDNITRDDQYFCPLCRGRVIYKKGIKIQSHFAHEKNSNCTYNTYKKESKEHLEVKKILYQHFKNKNNNVTVEYIFKTVDSLQVADVYLMDKNIAFEYQRSVIPFSEIKKRTDGYNKANITLIWLIDVCKFVKELTVQNNIVYIRYAPFVDNFLNYHKGCIFFYGYDREKHEIVFYQLWSHNLKKRNAVCKKRVVKLENFDLPLQFTYFKDDLCTPLKRSDIENYIAVQLKFDKTVKNKILSSLYNQRITTDKIPKYVGINFNEQVLFRTPLLIWQLEMRKLIISGKEYSEILRYMLNFIQLKDSIYILNKTKIGILTDTITKYYKILLKNMK